MTDATFWDNAATKYAKSQISDLKGYHETLDRMKEILQPHHNVVEIGCGTGSTALDLATGVGRYIGTDVSPKMIAIAEEKLTSGTPEQLSFAVHAAGDIPDGSHNIIIALNLLHLVDDLEDVLRSIHTALPAGGQFIAKTGLLRDGLFILRWIIPVMKMIGKAPYVRNLSHTEFIGLLEHTGFEVTETLTQSGIVPRLFTVATKR